MTIPEQLDEIIEMLKRIESRQVHTTELVEQTEKMEEQHQVGSFATVEKPHD